MKLILEAIKALFRKVEASRTHWDTRRITNTPSVTVAGNTVRWGYIKVADSIDFNIDSIVSVTRSGSDGLNSVDKPVELIRDYRNAVDIYWDDGGSAVYFPTQEDADDWYDEPESENPFTPGLYMSVGCHYGDYPDGIGAPVEVTYSFGVATGELKKLDEKYLPDKVTRELSNIRKVGTLAGDAADMAAVALSRATTAVDASKPCLCLSFYNNPRIDLIRQGTVHITSGSYSNLRSFLNRGELPFVLLSGVVNEGDFTNTIYARAISVFYGKSGTIGIFFHVRGSAHPTSYIVTVRIDNTGILDVRSDSLKW